MLESAFLTHRRRFASLLGWLLCLSLVPVAARAEIGGLAIGGGALATTIFEADASAEVIAAAPPLLLDEPVAGELVPASDLPVQLLETGPTPDPEAVLRAPPEIHDISALAADGMLLEEHPVDEMPYEASSGRWFWNGGWYVGGESLWLDRSRNNRVVIARDTPITPGSRESIPLTTSSQQFDIAPGARVTIGKSLGRDYIDRDRYLEFLWYGGLAWDDTATFNARPDGKFVSPLNPNAFGFNGSTQFSTLSTTDFNSWEVNYKLRRRLGRDQLVMSPNGNWTRHAERGWLPGLIIGTRIAHVNDFLTIQSSIPGIPLSQFGGTYQISATNWLVGLNVGGELLSQNEFYYWGLRGRAAPSISIANSSQSVFGTNSFPAIGPIGTTSFTGGGAQTFAGVITDLTLLAGWNITPNLSLQAGYDFLWVAGIATAPRQIDLQNENVDYVDAGGQMFYNGISFGFNSSW